MLNRNCLSILFLVVFIWQSSVGQQTKQLLPTKVFILGGQSNMDGCGLSEELPEAYQAHSKQIVMWDNKEKKWVDLGTDSFAIRRKFKFGPEIAFSHILSKKFPNISFLIN